MTKKTTRGTIPAKLREYIDLDNIAERLSAERLVEIGCDIVTEAEEDEASRYEWNEQYMEALKIATQVIESKNTPWPNAANVKYPLILNACIQYNARTNPEIVQGEKVVNVSVMIPDPTDEAEERATRLSDHMSYQLLGQCDNWKSDTDKLLMCLPLIGVMYRKTYFDAIEKKPQVDLCLPSDIIVHNDVSSLEKAQRVTHILHLTDNDLLERMRAGLYTEIPLDELSANEKESEGILMEYEMQPASASSIKGIHEVYEQHTFLDLDNDGYKEPYVVTVHRATQQVLRIVARYDEDSFIFNKNTSQFIKIKPIHYFTDYHFLPSPDGTYHSMGFGRILYPINETINTLINQMLDAGTLANRGGGFIAKELRVRKEELKFKLGEFKQINVPTGMNLTQNIVPLPTKEASPTLFQLLSLMMDAGKEVASIGSVLQGQVPAANTPATTVIAMIEQGTKVYSSMLYRLYASFKKEYEKLYELNKKYLDEYETFYFAAKSGIVTLEDYKAPDYGIFPVADPSISSDAQRMARIQALLQLMSAPGVDQHEILRRYLVALKVPDADKILPPPPTPEELAQQPPSPEQLMQEAELKKINMETADILMRRELEALKVDLEEKRLQLDAASAGVDATSQRVTSVAKLAEIESLAGQQNVAEAELQTRMMQQQFPVDTSATEQQLANVEQVLPAMLGMQQSPQPQEAAGSQQQGTESGESGNISIPSEFMQGVEGSGESPPTSGPQNTGE